MAERELLLSGIGGQGVQLAAQVLARAAIVDGREAMLFGSYGGMMRGGNTHATVVVADGPVQSPPTVARAWGAIVMHHDYWEFVRDRLRPGSVVLVNSTVFQGEIAVPGVTVVDVPATDLALGLEGTMTASMVMVGALAAATGFVRLASAEAAVEQALPSYRTRHVALNHAALAAGAGAVVAGAHPAWSEVPA